MHSPGTLIRRDVIGEHAQDLSLQKWMCERRVFQFFARKTRYLAGPCKVATLDCGFGQRIGHNVDCVSFLQCYIVQPGVEGDGHGSWKSPWSGGPDDGADVLTCQSGVNL